MASIKLPGARTVSNAFVGNDQIKVVASASFDALARLDEKEDAAW